MEETTISDKRRIFEILAVFTTGLGKFVFMDLLDYRFPFIVTAIVLWSLYISIQTKKTPTILRYWGFRSDNFRPALNIVLPFGIVSILTFFAIGYLRDTLNLTWHIIPILIIYPMWGVIQQFLVIGLVAGNLHDQQKVTLKKVTIILITAALFGGIHYPYVWLMFGTFLLASFYGYVYLKEKNLWVLGLFHGWLGGLFFYTVVNRDPFIEVFGKYIA